MPPVLSPSLLLPLVLMFVLVAVRIAFLLVAAPLFGTAVLPGQLRAAAVVVLSVALFPGLANARPPSLEPSSILIAVLGEAALGASAGLAVRILFAAAEGAGHVVGISMGIGFSQIVDPMSSTPSMITTRFFNTVMSLMFLVMDGHHVLIRLLARSFRTLPPGQVIPDPEMGIGLARAASAIFTGMIELAAPVLIVLLATMIALGLLTRVAPKMNLFILSFAICIALGLIVLRTSMPTMAAWMGKSILEVEPAVLRVWEGR
ncbi:MAG: flagellar biosynthetic protein FliR [Deltaproteobacteria bacterium]|nr:flagellar biosynthetic protein FliR [Deltaproteobacteria bacterium]